MKTVNFLHRAHYLVPALCALLLASCQSTSGGRPAVQYVTEGSRLVLHKRLNFGAGNINMILQNGQHTTQWRADEYTTACTVKRDRRKDASQIVDPTTFYIYKVVEGSQAASAGKQVYASIGPLAQTGTSVFYVHLYVRSGGAPHITRVVCQKMDSPPGESWITAADIQGALGEVFTLELAGKAAQGKARR